jgi:hypothetical protein
MINFFDQDMLQPLNLSDSLFDHVILHNRETLECAAIERAGIRRDRFATHRLNLLRLAPPQNPKNIKMFFVSISWPLIKKTVFIGLSY